MESAEQEAAGAAQSPSASTWARAREASNQIILQAAMEDLESKAAKLEQELHASKAKVEEQESQLMTLKSGKEQLQTSVEGQSTKLQSLQSDYQATTFKYQSLQETSKSNGERSDRLEAEADALREEIR
jgi:chromosome segregation ATPase